MIIYLTYKNKIKNINEKRLPKIASNSSQNHQRLKSGRNKDVKSWINHWEIQEQSIMHSIDNTTNIVTSKFKENMWCDKELVDKRKLRYYKVVINPNLEDQDNLLVLRSAKNKISIAKIRTNSHKLHSETGH
jgi:hypothetical protein